jgi:hypothetical protein
MRAYVGGTTTPSAGLSEGQITFASGYSTSGSYIAYLLRDNSTDVIASEPFQVSQPPTNKPSLLSIRPANNAANVSPRIDFLASITNGATKVVTNSVVLTVDNVPVQYQLSQQNDLVTISYSSPTLLGSGSTHNYTLIYSDNSPTPVWSTNQATFTIATYTDIVLGQPHYFENFDSTPEGSLPAGWSVTNYSSINDVNVDLQDLTFAFANWVVIDRSRFTNAFLS